MKIAVTGASGKLGTAIINELVSKADLTSNVIGISRSKPSKDLGVEIRQADYADYEAYEKALKNIDVLLLISGMNAPDKRIKEHQNVIKAAKICGVKKLVYTSIMGCEKDTGFKDIVQSNRQTEKDVQESTLDWIIGRNGLYIEPDLEYVNNYVKEGGIVNCAKNGKCGYTSRLDLARAYTNLCLDESKNNKIYNLCMKEPITQSKLANAINKHFGTKLCYKECSYEEFAAKERARLGDFIGGIVAGIYQAISKSCFVPTSNDFENASLMPHRSLDEMIKGFKQ